MCRCLLLLLFLLAIPATNAGILDSILGSGDGGNKGGKAEDEAPVTDDKATV
jgi:hypothetical protein